MGVRVGFYHVGAVLVQVASLASFSCRFRFEAFGLGLGLGLGLVGLGPVVVLFAPEPGPELDRNA